MTHFHLNEGALERCIPIRINSKSVTCEAVCFGELRKSKLVRPDKLVRANENVVLVCEVSPKGFNKYLIEKEGSTRFPQYLFSAAEWYKKGYGVLVIEGSNITPPNLVVEVDWGTIADEGMFRRSTDNSNAKTLQEFLKRAKGE